MSIHRKNPKRDKSERPIIEALERVGASVVQVSAKDAGDLLVGFRGLNYLLEVKTGKAKSRSNQVAFADNWRGQYALVRSVEEALQVIGAI